MARRESAARRYAEAAYEVARRDDTVATWRAELEAVAAVVADPRVGRALADPSIPLEARRAIVDSLEARIGRPVRNLVKLLVLRDRIHELPRVAAEFARLDDARQGITHATVTSTAPLAADELAAITARLETLTGARVALDATVDPALLGGLVVRIGDQLIDASVRSRLERLRNQVLSGAR